MELCNKIGIARPLKIQYPNVVYHVTNRGNERKEIFKDDLDREHFLEILLQSLLLRELENRANQEILILPAY